MHNFYKLLLSISLFILLIINSACNENTSSTPEKDIYFNLSTLLDEHMELLDSLKPKVNKMIDSKGTKEEKEINIENWKQELYLFKDADINKSAYEGLYKKINSTSENQETETYQVLSDNLSTKELSVSRINDKLHIINIAVSQENILYTTQKNLKLSFEVHKDQKVRIKKYEIKGTQSSLFGHKNDFNIQGIIQYE